MPFVDPPTHSDLCGPDTGGGQACERTDRPSQEWWRRLSGLIGQLAAVYLYICLPRVFLAAAMPGSELSLTRGFLDRRLAYMGVLLAVYHLLRLVVPRSARGILLAWLHVDFLFGALEAGLLYEFGIGFSPLFFYHLQSESVRLALTRYWPHIGLVLAILFVADRCLRRLLSDPPSAAWGLGERAVVLLIVLFGIRSVDILHRHGVPEEFAPMALLLNWGAYGEEEGKVDRLSLNQPELEYLRALGIGGGLGHSPQSRPPATPINLVTIYLEGFQANFTQAGGSPLSGLTPNLDRFASRFVRFDNFYNAVTPTINALISSQCGILSAVENTDLDVDRGYTRNLVCLSDHLHQAGYYQAFLGGADSDFSGKRVFLSTHHYDEVWGQEQWSDAPAYASEEHNEWGLHDTDLVREAIARLPELDRHRHFHLSLLTLNTHPPGFLAPDCPEYAPGETMLSAIHCSDQAIGMLLDALECGGYLRDTAIVVMGDHMMFPSAENAEALGPLSAGWFGKVFMALSYPGVVPRRIQEAGYTPDFASIALDLLKFKPVPQFPFGQSTFSAPAARPTLLARRFQILGGRMIPPEPDLSDECDEGDMETAKLDSTNGSLSACEREKIVAFVMKTVTSAALPPVLTQPRH